MPPTVRRATAERVLFSLLCASAALMLAGYGSDLAGLRIRGWTWIAAGLAAVSVWRVATLDNEDDADGHVGELACAALTGGLVAGYLAWLASPSLLPVTDGPDVVHHLQLIHHIQRTGALPHDPALTPYLLEMMNYTPGSHIAVALVANAARADGLRVLLPVALWFVALKVAAVYVIAARVTPRGPGRVIAALSAPILLFAPAAYAVGALYRFFFFAQVVSEAFAVGAVLAVLGWVRTRRVSYPLVFACCGIGVMLSWPVYLAPIVAVMAAASLFAPGTWHLRARDAAIALAPVALVALAHVARHAQGGGILTASGAVTAPSVDVFGVGFLVLTAAGLTIGVLRAETRPVAIFLAAILVTAAALAMVSVRAGTRGFYLPFKLVYLAIAPAAILGSAALAASASAVRFRRAASFVVVLVAAAVTLPRVPVVRPRSPITLAAHDAGVWVRANLNPRCVDYLSRHWLTGYWLHLDVLGNPRDSDRMRMETFEFRDIAARWIEGRGLPYAIVEDPAATIPRELRPDLTVLAAFPPFAVVTHPAPRCP